MPESPPQQLIHLVIKVSKADSSFCYFTFEALEGICFYSTLKSEIGQNFRLMEIVGTVDFQEEIFSHLNALNKRFPIEIIKNNIIPDGNLPRL